MKLKDRVIEGLACAPCRKKRLVVNDALSGLGALMTGKGKKSFVAR